MDITLTIKAEAQLLKVLERFANAIELKQNSPAANQIETRPLENIKPVTQQTQPATPLQQTPVIQPVQQVIQPVQQVIQPITAPKAPQLTQPMQQNPANVQPVPTAVQEYTMDQLAVAATQIVDAGRRTELVSLLTSFGVQALTMLPKEQYGAFATQLRAMGAKI